MASVFDYQFNIGGNFTAAMDGMAESTGRFNVAVEGTYGWLGKLGQTFAVLDLAGNYVGKFNDALGSFYSSGISLDSQMHDLSAIAGVTGNTLKEIEGYARESAKTFGIDASQAVEGYKLLLSQLSPELGKYPEALQSMGESISTTSKLMGGDATAAAEVLTTAMNQYGVSLEYPIKAGEEMARMMNVMAAAGQEGSAELPAIKVALEQCGMAAKAANVSFEETNAAIQVLDKAGKKGSEGGVALRNTLAILGQGRFLPKDTREALEAAGIDVLKLSDTSVSLKDRLEMLKPVLNDAALFSKLFGMENANAARALVQGTDELGRLTEAVTGTSSAEEQAVIVMDSFAERQARINQRFNDIKISIFQASGDLGVPIFVKQRFNDGRHSHFHICAVRPELLCLGPLVPDDTPRIVILPQIVYIHRIHSCKAKNHHGYVTAELRQRISHLALRDREREKLPASLRRYGQFFRPVSRRYPDLYPGISPYAYHPRVIIVVFQNCGFEHLTHADGVQLLGPVSLFKRLDPPVHKMRGKMREHDFVSPQKPFQMLQSKPVVLCVAFLSVVNHSVYVHTGIVRETDVIIQFPISFLFSRSLYSKMRFVQYCNTNGSLISFSLESSFFVTTLSVLM